MVNKYYQKHTERLRKEACEDIKIFLKKKKTKSANMLEKGIKSLLKKKKKKGVSIIKNVSKSYLSVEEIII